MDISMDISMDIHIHGNPDDGWRSYIYFKFKYAPVCLHMNEQQNFAFDGLLSQ